MAPKDIEIITKMQKQGIYTLEKSTFFLGILTGNNSEKIKQEKLPQFEEIYTGKDVLPYKLKEATNFVHFNKEAFQQCAQEEFFRAKEKLIYKFINAKLVFSYDKNGSLMLNSANGIIPVVPNMSIKTILAFLNSKAFEFFYTKNFSDVKVLKNNLLKLPFPKISEEVDKEITTLVDQILVGNLDNAIESKIQQLIYSSFNLTNDDILYIENSL